MRSSTLQCLVNLLPSTGGRAKGISEGYIFSMGVHHLQGFRVTFEELT